MRLLIATRQLAFGGGAETHLEAVIPLLRARNHTLAILHEDTPRPDSRTLLSSAQDIPCIPSAGRLIPEVIRQVAEFAPDLVYNHGLDSPELEEAVVQRFPALLYAHNYYGICVSGTRCHAGAIVEPCQRRFGLACLALYLPKHCGGRSPRTMLRLYRLEARRHRILHRYAAILVASRYVGSQFERNGIPTNQIHLVPLFPPGIQPSPTPPTQRPFSGKVLFLGRITPPKGLDHLADALITAQKHLQRPLQLLIAGDGPSRDPIAQHAQRNGLATQCLGWINLAERNRLMTEVDLVAVPSLWPEPFGLVGLEAACAGVPAVAYPNGGIPEWLIPGVTGELADPGPPQPDRLAHALTRALQDPAHWHALRIGAWKNAHKWSAEAHVDQWTAVVRGLQNPRQ